jgi:3,4-dihydroxy 2-butanone 4-phosphate synthase / GTP cyclohydrolase II
VTVGCASTPEVAESFTDDTGVAASALAAFASGRPVVLLTIGAGAMPPQLVIAAQRIEPAPMAFMVRYTSGFISVCLPTARCDELVLPIFANDKCLVGEPLPGVSVDALDGVGTGISAVDRCLTARRLADPSATAQDFRRPGHVVPLRVPDACRDRADSLPAAALGLCQLTGLIEATVMGDLVRDDAEVMTAAEAAGFAARHELTCVAVVDVMRLAMPLRARVVG